jgi:hypothetical protein
MTIYESILHRLAAGEAQTLTQMLSSLPELAAAPYGSDALYLLLRLDRRLHRLNDGRWILATAPQTAEQRIVASAKAYLDSLPGGGALLDSVVTRVISETNYASDAVRSVVLRDFVNTGRVVAIN